MEARNPWLTALVVVSVAFLLLAVALLFLYANSDQQFSSARTPGIYQIIIQNLLYQAPPALITAGLLGFIARIALAASWRAR